MSILAVIWMPQEPPARMSGTDKLAYTTFAELGGGVIDLDEVRAELQRLPLDLVLGVLSRLSALYLKHGSTFSDPRFQGEYLARAIVDDFPCRLAGAPSMYAPGRVPITGGKHLFMHEHNFCALARLALAHCKTDRITARLSGNDYGRVCRLLLILNDHLSVQRVSSTAPTSLTQRRDFAINTLYYGQFDMNDVRTAYLGLARLRTLLVEHMPAEFSSTDAFRSSTGLDLEMFFDTAIFLLSYAMSVPDQITEEKSPWGSLDGLTLEIPENDRPEVVRFVHELTQHPLDVKCATLVGDPMELIDFEELQSKPFVEGRRGEIIVPVYTLLVRQLLSYPILALSRHPTFRDALGEAYESYAHQLVLRIAAGDRAKWTPRRGEQLNGGEIDSLLYRDEVSVLMEHKAKQVVATLGSLNTARNALGPPQEELTALSPGRKPKDKGGVTQPIWQFCALAPEYAEHSERSWNHRPANVFPLVTLMEAYRVDEWVRRGYLEPLMVAAEIELPSSWRPIQWLHVSDLEALAELAERRSLDLVDLLQRKTKESWKRFDVFLAEIFSGVPADRKLWSGMQELVRRSDRRFFGGSGGA